MPKHYYPIALLALALCLTGCSGNYKYSDDQYRPLGDPQVVKRGN
nr:type VI secretion protein [uncultured Pseudomonas sp.]